MPKKQLTPTDIAYLETFTKSGIYFIAHHETKKVWMTYALNPGISLLKNIALIKQGVHTIKSIDGWDVQFLDQGEFSEEELRYKYHDYCMEFVNKGYQLLNRKLTYSLKGMIQKHHGGEPRFLYYVWLCTKQYRLKLVAVFSKAVEGEKFFKANKDKPFDAKMDPTHPNYSDFINYQKIKDDYEYNSVIKGKK